MEYIYEGPLATHIRGLVVEKRACGYSYDASASILRAFDAFVKESFPDACTLTRELAVAWTQRRETECIASLLNRVKPVRQLALYMNRLGMKAYVLTGEGFGRPERPRPHIFTERELRLFFNAVDAYPPCGKNPRRGLVAQALFRTIYCLGLRPCEAMRLTVPCVDLTRGSVYILQAKGDKDRVVYLSGDLHEALLRYSKEIGTAMPGRKAFFPNWKGDHLAIKNVENWFNELWRSLPGDITAQRKPSIQSLRHTFACRRIRLMAEEGKDLRSSIYYLSEHMGHDSFKETEYYLHLLPERFPELLGKVSGLSDALLPEVVCNG